MLLGPVFLAAALAAPLLAEGTQPRGRASEYPAHAKLDKAAIGAEYMVRSFGHPGQTFIAGDYLVIEAAVYPAGPEPLPVAASHFTLRLNGKKPVLHAQAPQFVAASLKYPDWEGRPAVAAGAGLGDVGVIIGRPETVGRFPGDPRPDRSRLPRAPGVDRSGEEKEAPARPEEVAVETALPEGSSRHPVAGFLYFAYKGKPKSVRSLELIYNGPAGAATLRLLPGP